MLWRKSASRRIVRPPRCRDLGCGRRRGGGATATLSFVRDGGRSARHGTQPWSGASGLDTRDLAGAENTVRRARRRIRQSP
jgi:hypothetical protein